MPATSRKAQPDRKLRAERDRLAEERVKIERRHAPDYPRIEQLDARLKEIATEMGSFKLTLANGDTIAVTGAVAAESKGEQPVLQTEVWQALSEIERRRLKRDYPGLIKVEPIWGRASSGRVSLKVHTG